MSDLMCEMMFDNALFDVDDDLGEKCNNMIIEHLENEQEIIIDDFEYKCSEDKTLSINDNINNVKVVHYGDKKTKNINDNLYQVVIIQQESLHYLKNIKFYLVYMDEIKSLRNVCNAWNKTKILARKR